MADGTWRRAMERVKRGLEQDMDLDQNNEKKRVQIDMFKLGSLCCTITYKRGVSEETIR